MRARRACTHCHSNNFVPTQKGFDTGKAVSGGLLIGPLELLAGAVGVKR
jgi:hypothetical protein